MCGASREAAALINGVPLKQFPRLAHRIAQRLALGRQAAFFSDAEEAQLRAVLCVADEALRTIVDFIAFVFEQAAYSARKPAIDTGQPRFYRCNDPTSSRRRCSTSAWTRHTRSSRRKSGSTRLRTTFRTSRTDTSWDHARSTTRPGKSTSTWPRARARSARIRRPSSNSTSRHPTRPRAPSTRSCRWNARTQSSGTFFRAFNKYKRPSTASRRDQRRVMTADTRRPPRAPAPSN
mmetsp:Transcript_26988/g.93175  ORF Transcript_26988/g.93175 Transcript_26988/m.93175 type:complete len:235 (+) Transcript_26988:104-808(+)